MTPLTGGGGGGGCGGWVGGWEKTSPLYAKASAPPTTTTVSYLADSFLHYSGVERQFSVKLTTL